MRCDPRSPPRGLAHTDPLCRHALTHRIEVATATPNRSAAPRRDMPPSTAAIRRERRSSESDLAMQAGLPASTQLQADPAASEEIPFRLGTGETCSRCSRSLRQRSKRHSNASDPTRATVTPYCCNADPSPRGTLRIARWRSQTTLWTPTRCPKLFLRRALGPNPCRRCEARTDEGTAPRETCWPAPQLPYQAHRYAARQPASTLAEPANAGCPTHARRRVSLKASS